MNGDASSFRKSTESAKNSMSSLGRAVNKTKSGYGSWFSANKKIGQSYSNISKDVNRASTSIGKFNGLFKASAVIFGLKMLSNAIGQTINASMDAIETQNLFRVSLGKTADEAEKVVEGLSKAYGLDPTNLKSSIGTYALLARSMGFSAEQALTLSTQTAQLALDLASLTNVPITQVMGDLKSGLVGQSETVYKYGIDVTEAGIKAEALAEGITKSVRNMSQGEKMALRYNVMMRATTLAQGDFARTLESPANQSKILTERLVTLSRSIGNIFIPMLTIVLPYLNAFVILLTEVANKVADFFGYEAPANPDLGLNGVGEDAQGATEDIEDTGDALKKLNKTILGIDELNVMSKPKEDTGVNAGGSILGSMDLLSPYEVLKDVKSKANDIAEEIKTAIRGIMGVGQKVGGYFGTDFAPNFLTGFSKIKQGSVDLFKAYSELFNNIIKLGEPLKKWFTGDLPTLLRTLVSVTGNILGDLLSKYAMVYGDIWNKVAYPVISNFITIGLPDLTRFTTDALLVFNDLYNSLSTVFDNLWSVGVMPLLTKLITLGLPIINDFGVRAGNALLIFTSTGIEQFNKLYTEGFAPPFAIIIGVLEDVMQIFSDLYTLHVEPMVTAVSEAFTGFSDTFSKLWTEVLEPIWNDFYTTVDKLWTEHLEPLLKELGDFVLTVVEFALVIYTKFILPIINYFIDKFAPAFKVAFGYIVSVVSNIVAIIADVFRGVIKVAKGVIEFWTGVFTGDWKKAWKGIQDIVSGAFTAVVGVLKGVINAIIATVEFLINSVVIGINAFLRKVQDFVDGANAILKKINVPTIDLKINPIGEVKIPRLAKGGIATSSTFAEIGEAGAEAVIPLSPSKLEKYFAPILGNISSDSEAQYDTVYRAMKDAIRDTETEQTSITNLYIDGVYDNTVKTMKRKNVRSGRVIVPVGG